MTIICFSHKVPGPLDAITLALRERVTRDNAIGQGNGLWGLSEPINITETLNGHSPVNLWLESFESPSGEDFVISIAEVSEGTGTRKAAEKVRHMALNILKEGRRRVALYFSGVNLISSSYADELVGKLVAEVGFFGFGTCFSLINLSDFNQKIMDRSVQQRMAQQYYNEPVPEDDSE